MTGKQWKKRSDRDTSQQWRRGIQLVFLTLNLWIGIQFVLFVRGYEGRWVPWAASRPPGVEGWLPIAGMMNTKYLLETGEAPLIHPAAMVLFITFVFLSLLFRKAFCGWLCPVGTVSEWLWKVGREAFGRTFMPPKWLDLTLKTCKYALFGAFFYAVSRMDAADVGAFLASPYGLLADVKMLNFFRFLSTGAAVFLAVVVMTSMLIPNAWCRYLCPYGALMGLAALASPARIRREEEACIDCGKCARVCPSRLPVDKLVQIRSAECIGCLECVTACPAEGALRLAVPGRKQGLSGRAVAMGVAAIFLVAYAGARLTGHWESAIPDAVYRELIPDSRGLEHPR